MANIKFNYLYRDGGNYKVYGSHIFENPDNISIIQIEEAIKRSLIDGEFFNPKEWDLEPLKFDDWNQELDHLWNEFESIELTSEHSTSGKSITKFLKIITFFEPSARF
jgi:hypothetical protein